MPKPTSTWKSIERNAAKLLRPFFGEGTDRNPLSGGNNRRDSGEPRRGDVIIPDNHAVIFEVKHRKRIAFHRFFDQAMEDCVSSKFDKEHAVLISHEKQSQRYLVTISMTLFLRLIQLLKDAGQFNSVFPPR